MIVGKGGRRGGAGVERLFAAQPGKLLCIRHRACGADALLDPPIGIDPADQCSDWWAEGTALRQNTWIQRSTAEGTIAQARYSCVGV